MTYSIAYIIGLTHSGSTLLESLLGAHSEMIGVGEIFQLSSYVHLDRKKSEKTKLGNECTCGAPTIYDCEFWISVDRTLQSSSGLTLADLDLKAVDPARFRSDNKALFDAVAQVSGARVIIDSSKSIRRYRRLESSMPVPVRAIHLLRDPRGQVYSIMQRTGRKPIGPATKYCKATIQSIALLASRDHIRVRYEPLTANPEHTIRELTRWLQLGFEPNQMDWAATPRHSIAGNAMRATATSTIRPDMRWREELRPSQVLAIDIATFPASLVGRLVRG